MDVGENGVTLFLFYRLMFIFFIPLELEPT